MTNSKDNEIIDAIALVLHRIERKYATESLFGEMCGAAVLCLIARYQGSVNDVTNLRSLLLSIGIEEGPAQFIEEAIGGHWGEYYEFIGKYSEDDLVDLFECKYLKALAEWTKPAHRFDTLSMLLLQLKGGESCLDICSGAGFFMTTAWHEMLSLNGRDAAINLSGIEFNRSLAGYASILSLVRGTGGKVHVEDCFDPRHIRAKYDKVHCDAPFGLNVRGIDFANVRKSLCGVFPDFPQIALGSADWLFAARAVAAMKSGGRAVVVMPRAALSGAQNAAYRRYFLSRRMIESVIAFPGGVYPGTSVSVAVVTFARDSSCVKLYDAAGQGSYNGDPESIDFQQIAKDLEKVWNYEDIVTKDWNYLLTYEEADLDPTVHLAAPLSYEGKRPFGDCVSRVFRGTSLPKDRLRELHLDGGGKVAARYLTSGDIEDGVIGLNERQFLRGVPSECKGQFAEYGDLILSRLGNPCKMAVIEDTTPCVVDGNLIVCKPRDREWSYYLLGYLMSPDGARWLQRISAGLQQTISLKKLPMIPVPVADRERMRKISEAVSGHLSKIEKLKRELEQNRSDVKYQFDCILLGGGTDDGN